MIPRNAMFLIGAAVALGMAINVRDGEYWPRALLFLTVALAFCAAGVLVPNRPVQPSERKGVYVVVALWVAAHFTYLLLSPPSGWNSWSNDLVRPQGSAIYYAGGAVALLSMIVALRWWRVAAGILLLTHLAVGFWFIRATPSPQIDVHVFQQEAARALLDGRNPYAMSVPDIYASTQPGERAVYGSDMVRDGGQLGFGFPYPPVSLYLSTAGYALAGDHRYAQLLAMTAAGALMIFAAARPWAVLMAAMFLFTPRGFFVLGRAWTEPFVVLFLAATVFCAARYVKLLPVALGLLLASKQYMLLVVPLVVLLRDWSFRDYAKVMAKAVGVAVLVTIPFAVWDWPAFWNSLVTVQKVAPFREDSLSYLVWIYHRTGLKLSVLPAFVAAAVAIGLAVWRVPRTPAGFARAVAFVYLVFICLNKQAFANYYYLVIGALWCSLAVADSGGQARPLNETAPNVR